MQRNPWDPADAYSKPSFLGQHLTFADSSTRLARQRARSQLRASSSTAWTCRSCSCAADRPGLASPREGPFQASPCPRGSWARCCGWGGSSWHPLFWRDFRHAGPNRPKLHRNMQRPFPNPQYFPTKTPPVQVHQGALDNSASSRTMQQAPAKPGFVRLGSWPRASRASADCSRPIAARPDADKLFVSTILSHVGEARRFLDLANLTRKFGRTLPLCQCQPPENRGTNVLNKGRTRIGILFVHDGICCFASSGQFVYDMFHLRILLIRQPPALALAHGSGPAARILAPTLYSAAGGVRQRARPRPERARFLPVGVSLRAA